MHAITDTADSRPRFARTVVRSLTKGAAWFAILGMALVAMSWTNNLRVEFTPNTAEVMVDAMLTEHGCWQGMAPTGAVAHHVVVTMPDETRPTYGGQALTDRALEQVLFHGEYVGQVHGFCR
jgi:hypothetical protein